MKSGPFSASRRLRIVGIGLVSLLTLGHASATPDLAAEVRTQDRHIAALFRHLSQLQQRQLETERKVEELATMREEIRQLGEQVTTMRDQIVRVQEDIEAIRHDFSEYRSSYRSWVRIDAVGEERGTLVTLGGKTYEEVVIRRVTDAGLEIRHAGGSARLRHDELPVEERERFQWDQGAAMAVFVREAKQDFVRDRLAEIAATQRKEKRAEAERTAATEKRISDLERRLASAQSASSGSRLDSSGRLGERRMIGNPSSSRYRSSSYYRSRPTIYYYPSNSRTYVRSTPTVRQPPRTWDSRSFVRPPVRTTIPQRPMCPGGRD